MCCVTSRLPDLCNGKPNKSLRNVLFSALNKNSQTLMCRRPDETFKSPNVLVSRCELDCRRAVGEL